MQGVFLCVIRPQSLAAAELPSVTDEFSRPMSGAQICPQLGAITGSKFLYCGAGRVVEIAANGVFAKIDLDTAKPSGMRLLASFPSGIKNSPQVFQI